MRYRFPLAVVLTLVLVGVRLAWGEEARDLRLVPFPKEVRLEEGAFPLDRPLALQIPKQVDRLLAGLVGDELQQAGLPRPEVRTVAGDAWVVRLSAEAETTIPKTLLDRLPPFPAAPLRQAAAGSPETASKRSFRSEGDEEGYVLAVWPEEIIAGARGEAGLRYAVQTLRQLIRANRRDAGLPCLVIRDWPSLRWRCFQDDITRGPSPRLETLKLQVDLGSFFKMNLMTYYMESQFAFRKHPQIGPKDGSLTAEELAAWVAYAKPRGVDILGNQQSFGHFQHILKHDAYAHLRETPSLLCPTKEESYRLLDDFYAEVCPHLPFPMFNVCCDETWGLGTGPSKARADKIGVGGVYVEHVRRVHDLLKEKYGKRMMMWGDIILQHPEHLEKIPKDTIMLTWGYGPKESFEDQILPFARSGYEFFVCPGVSNWSRILPDFGCATVNIRNFVRDGARHGAIGMLNTDWEDDGESLNAPTWHGDAWGAECAWNASATTPEEFNRRIGAVLFGEQGDRFGRAIERLSQTHRLAGMDGMNNRRFWANDFLPKHDPATIRRTADRLLEIVRPAIADLEACRKEATHHAELLDGVLFGARRMELIGQRMLDGLEAARLYTQACDGAPEEAVPLVAQAEALVRKNREAHEALGRRFAELWLREAEPYALDWTLKRYADVVKWYDDLAARLAEARQKAASGGRLPPPESLGLLLPEAFPRRSRPHARVDAPLKPEAPWSEPSATHRLGLVVDTGPVDRYELPVEVNVSVPAELADRPIRAFCVRPGERPREVAAQLDATDRPSQMRLVLLLPGAVPKNQRVEVFIYLGLAEAPPAPAGAVSTKDAADGMKWIENDQVRLLLGPEGAHIYRWEVQALGGRDLTMPGQRGWAGFSDMHPLRSVPFQLTCVADGPALVRYECVEPSGLVKTIGLFAGCSWIEVTLNTPTPVYWDFDNPENFAADGPTPGTYLFSGGQTGAVGPQADGVAGQVEAVAFWGIKYNRDRVALGIATPEVAALHHVAPGSGAGGVGIEHSPAAGHFVTFAGLLDDEPAATMNRLKATLDFNNQPQVVAYALQRRAVVTAVDLH